MSRLFCVAAVSLAVAVAVASANPFFLGGGGKGNSNSGGSSYGAPSYNSGGGGSSGGKGGKGGLFGGLGGGSGGKGGLFGGFGGKKGGGNSNNGGSSYGAPAKPSYGSSSGEFSPYLHFLLNRNPQCTEWGKERELSLPGYFRRPGQNRCSSLNAITCDAASVCSRSTIPSIFTRIPLDQLAFSANK